MFRQVLLYVHITFIPNTKPYFIMQSCVWFSN